MTFSSQNLFFFCFEELFLYHTDFAETFSDSEKLCAQLHERFLTEDELSIVLLNLPGGRDFFLNKEHICINGHKLYDIVSDLVIEQGESVMCDAFVCTDSNQKIDAPFFYCVDFCPQKLNSRNVHIYRRIF